MKDETVQKVVTEMWRLMKLIEEYEKYLLTDGSERRYQSKERAAVKRASMDLTRVLADLRQGR